MAAKVALICFFLTLTVCTGGVGWAQAIDFSKPMARMNVGIVGGGPPAAPSGDSCTGGLVLSAHFENSDTITDGGGCSAGDSSLTRTADDPTYSTTQKSDGTHSLFCDGGSGKYALLSISSGDIATHAEGTVVVDIYLGANFQQFNPTYILTIYNAANGDDIRLSGIRTDGTSNDIELRWRRKGWMDASAKAASNLSTGQWYTVTAQWKVGGDPNTLSVTANSATGTSTKALSNWAATPDNFKICQSHEEAAQTDLYVDILKSYTTSDL